MSLVQKIDGVEITNRVRLTGGSRGGVTGWPSNAWYGEPGIAGLEIDDPDGDLVIVPWTTYTADETADTTRPRIFTGWITAARIKRGPYRTGAGRVWDIDIIDQNAIFSFEVLRSSAASVRPAETDVARAQALIASHAMGATPIFDNGRLDTSAPLNQGPANYVTEYPQAVMESISRSDKNFFAYWDDDEDEISLSFGAATDNPLSSLAISNVIADQDATTFYPFLDAELKIDPAKQMSGVLLGYLGGYVYARDDDLFGPNEFSPVNFLRDDVYTTDRIGRLTTANAQVQVQLAQRAAPAESIVVTMRLPAAVVNEAHAGDAISVKFTHLPGYESETPMAIIRRNVIPSPGRRDFYDVTMELSNATNTDLPPGGGDPGDFPHETATCSPVYVQTATQGHDDPSSPANWPVFPAPLTEGNLLVACVTINGTPGEAVNPDGFTGIGAGWTDDPSGTKSIMQRLFYRVVQAGDDQTIDLTEVGTVSEHSSIVAEFELTDATLDEFVLTTSDVDQTDPQDYPFDAAPTPGDLPTLAIASLFPSLNVNDAWHPEEVSGAFDIGASGVGPVFGAGDEPKAWFGYKTIESSVAAGSVDFDVDGTDPSGNSRGYAGLLATFTGVCEGASGCPSPGQWVEDETVTLVGDDGTTACPFADGSLHVYIDNVEQTENLTAQDGEAGTFTLGFTPTPTEVCTVRYQGRVGS